MSFVGTFFPYQGSTQTLLFKIDGLCAAAGFTMLAISQGLFIAQVEQQTHSSDESIVTAVFFLIPSYLMIAYFGKFPKWLHIFGIVPVVPFFLLVVLYYLNGFAPNPAIRYIVYLTYQFITLCWAWQIWKQRKGK